jgi:hypothetical protein
MAAVMEAMRVTAAVGWRLKKQDGKPSYRYCSSMI